MALEDRGVRIFLNTHGRNQQEEAEHQELVQLLRYMEHTNDASPDIDSERIRRLRENVRSIQRNAEIGVKYMQAWEEKILDRQEARAEGLAEGLEKGLITGKSAGLAQAILELLSEYGEIPGVLRDRIHAEQDQEQLCRWLRMASGAGSIEAFRKQLKEND